MDEEDVQQVLKLRAESSELSTNSKVNISLERLVIIIITIITGTATCVFTWAGLNGKIDEKVSIRAMDKWGKRAHELNPSWQSPDIYEISEKK